MAMKMVGFSGKFGDSGEKWESGMTEERERLMRNERIIDDFPYLKIEWDKVESWRINREVATVRKDEPRRSFLGDKR